MIALTKAIGKDVAGSGILVNCIAPAVINTPILGQISAEHIAYMTARIPLGRVGEPAEVAALDLLAGERGDDRFRPPPASTSPADGRRIDPLRPRAH